MLKREHANIVICSENPDKSECKLYQMLRITQTLSDSKDNANFIRW